MKQIVKSICLLLAFSGCKAGDYPGLRTLYSDYLAGHEVKKERYEEALARYYALLENDGDRSGTHSNIGVLLNMVQKNDDALKSLQYALQLADNTQDKKMQFTVRYNLGVYFGAQKKIAEALENYQAALDLVPTSIEIKTNIELLIQQQQKDQQNKEGDKKEDNKQGEGQQDQKDNKDGSGQDQDKKDQKDSEGDKKEESEPKKEDQKKQSSPKYQPRPFKGDQLSEGDVKKILGELKEQEQKIRANFDKKEKGKSKGNEKDW